MGKDDLGSNVNGSNKVSGICAELLEVVPTAHAVALEFCQLARQMFGKSGGQIDEESNDTGDV